MGLSERYDALKLLNLSAADTTIQAGSGSPEGVVTGDVGDLWLRIDGGAGTTAYLKESGAATNTGWGAVASASGAGTNLTGLGVDERIPRWNGTDTLQSSGWSLDDANLMTAGGNLDMNDGNIQNVLNILDASGNVIVEFDSNPSAVNWIEFFNAASGSAPIIQPAGTGNDLIVRANTGGTLTLNAGVTNVVDIDAGLVDIKQALTIAGATTMNYDAANDALSIVLGTSLVNQAIVVTEDNVVRTTAMVSLTRQASATGKGLEITMPNTATQGLGLDVVDGAVNIFYQYPDATDALTINKGSAASAGSAIYATISPSGTGSVITAECDSLNGASGITVDMTANATGFGLNIDHAGTSGDAVNVYVASAAVQALVLSSNASVAHANADGFIDIDINHVSASSPGIKLDHAGSGPGIRVENTGTGFGLHVDCAQSTQTATFIEHAIGESGIIIRGFGTTTPTDASLSIRAKDTTVPLAYIEKDGTAAVAAHTLQLQDDTWATGNSIEVAHRSSGDGLHIAAEIDGRGIFVEHTPISSQGGVGIQVTMNSNSTGQAMLVAAGTDAINALEITQGKTTIRRLDITNEAFATTAHDEALKVTGGAHTSLTASTEFIEVDFSLNQTVQHATGALTTQRAMVIRNPTYSFAAASTITDGATLAITGAPAQGANAAITNAYALWVQAGETRLDGTLSIDGGAYFVTDALTSGAGTKTMDGDTTGDYTYEQSGASPTFAAPTNVRVGQTFNLEITDTTGAGTITWNAAFEWDGGSAPADLAAGEKRLISFRVAAVSGTTATAVSGMFSGVIS